MESLRDLVQMQHQLQCDSFNNDPTAMSPGHRAEYVRWNVLALEDELHEALQELGWKPWADSRHFNREAFLGELVDAFHFFMNLMLVATPDGDVAALVEEFTSRYVKKHEVNARRQEEGYDGISSKCPACRRALDDVGETSDGRCGACGTRL